MLNFKLWPRLRDIKRSIHSRKQNKNFVKFSSPIPSIIFGRRGSTGHPSVKKNLSPSWWTMVMNYLSGPSNYVNVRRAVRYSCHWTIHQVFWLYSKPRSDSVSDSADFSLIACYLSGISQLWSTLPHATLSGFLAAYSLRQYSFLWSSAFCSSYHISSFLRVSFHLTLSWVSAQRQKVQRQIY